MVAERAALDAQAYRLMLDQSASNDVLKRRYQSRLPLVYEARNLFDTLGAGTSNPPMVSRAEAPGMGAPVQPHLVDPPRQNHVSPGMSQHRRVITLTRWITLLPPIHDWQLSRSNAQ